MRQKTGRGTVIRTYFHAERGRPVLEIVLDRGDPKLLSWLGCRVRVSMESQKQA